MATLTDSPAQTQFLASHLHRYHQSSNADYLDRCDQWVLEGGRKTVVNRFCSGNNRSTRLNVRHYLRGRRQHGQHIFRVVPGHIAHRPVAHHQVRGLLALRHRTADANLRRLPPDEVRKVNPPGLLRQVRLVTKVALVGGHLAVPPVDGPAGVWGVGRRVPLRLSGEGSVDVQLADAMSVAELVVPLKDQVLEDLAAVTGHLADYYTEEEESYCLSTTSLNWSGSRI
ncbi:hypothetical protein TYRP_015717 [Tyrophagus putrescentiae]|nr:hypothetical protein TYRP_015717 [Tyrophagus putrescentiae]